MTVKKEYPTKYHYRNKNDSDKKFILTRMAWIPKELKDSISNQYEKLYSVGKNNGRRIANNFLHEVAKKYKTAPCDPQTVNGFYGQLLDMTENDRKEVFTSSGTSSKGNYKGPSIIEMAAQITHLESRE